MRKYKRLNRHPKTYIKNLYLTYYTFALCAPAMLPVIADIAVQLYDGMSLLWKALVSMGVGDGLSETPYSYSFETEETSTDQAQDVDDVTEDDGVWDPELANEPSWIRTST